MSQNSSMQKPTPLKSPPQQYGLIDSVSPEHLHPKLPALLYRQWLSVDETECLWLAAQALPWMHERLRCRGTWRTLKRKVVWMGDAGVCYAYSGRLHTPIPWTPEIETVRQRLSQLLNVPFNSVLGNYYADGTQAMGYHQDNEPELGKSPCIASISLGATRRFRFRHLCSGETVTTDLPAGSLLVMQDDCQQHWVHSLPPMRQSGARINLTFRYIIRLHQ